MASFIRLDLFPATVVVEGGDTYQPCRAVVTDDAVHVYVDAPGGPTEAFVARLEDFSGRRTIGFTAITGDGENVSINRASGCGCGSRLKGYRPFPGVPHSSSFS